MINVGVISHSVISTLVNHVMNVGIVVMVLIILVVSVIIRNILHIKELDLVIGLINQLIVAKPKVKSKSYQNATKKIKNCNSNVVMTTELVKPKTNRLKNASLRSQGLKHLTS